MHHARSKTRDDVPNPHDAVGFDIATFIERARRSRWKSTVATRKNMLMSTRSSWDPAIDNHAEKVVTWVTGRSTSFDDPKTPRRQHHHQPIKGGGHPSQSYLIVRQLPSHLEATSARVDVPMCVKVLSRNWWSYDRSSQLRRRQVVGPACSGTQRKLDDVRTRELL